MSFFNNLQNRFLQNWKSGITVSLISLPLSVSLAVASEASPVMGIITSIWAGLVASLWGGSNYNIVGPAGALSGILAAYSIAHGQSSLALLAIVSGIFIFIAYLLKLERYLVFIPGSTVHGFTLGVALIIGLGQLNNALGISGLPSHELFFQNLIETLKNLNLSSWQAVLLSFVGTAFLFIMKKYGSKKIPGPIILAPLGILLGYLATKGIISYETATLGSKFTEMTPTLFIKPDFSISSYRALITGGLTVALVAILETMLSAKIADGMTDTKYDKKKEMFGLSLANIASGLAGGLPATGVLARTALNVKTGANHKMSATINSISIIIISFLFLKYFTYIPMPIIASILVYVSVNMIETHHFKRLFKYDKKGFVIALIVAFVTIYQDPMIGLLVGIAMSLLLLVEKISRGQCELTLNHENKMIKTLYGDKIEKLSHEADTLVYAIKGELVYLNGQSHVSRFEHHFHNYNHVILKLRGLHVIDIDGVDALEEIISIIKSKGKDVFVTGVQPIVLETMKDARHFQELTKEGHVFPKTGDALRHLGFSL